MDIKPNLTSFGIAFTFISLLSVPLAHAGDTVRVRSTTRLDNCGNVVKRALANFPVEDQLTELPETLTRKLQDYLGRATSYDYASSRAYRIMVDGLKLTNDRVLTGILLEDMDELWTPERMSWFFNDLLTTKTMSGEIPSAEFRALVKKHLFPTGTQAEYLISKNPLSIARLHEKFGRTFHSEEPEHTEKYLKMMSVLERTEDGALLHALFQDMADRWPQSTLDWFADDLINRTGAFNRNSLRAQIPELLNTPTRFFEIDEFFRNANQETSGRSGRVNFMLYEPDADVNRFMSAEATVKGCLNAVGDDLISLRSQRLSPKLKGYESQAVEILSRSSYDGPLNSEVESFLKGFIERNGRRKDLSNPEVVRLGQAELGLLRRGTPPSSFKWALKGFKDGGEHELLLYLLGNPHLRDRTAASLVGSLRKLMGEEPNSYRRSNIVTVFEIMMRDAGVPGRVRDVADLIRILRPRKLTELRDYLATCQFPLGMRKLYVEHGFKDPDDPDGSKAKALNTLIQDVIRAVWP